MEEEREDGGGFVDVEAAVVIEVVPMAAPDLEVAGSSNSAGTPRAAESPQRKRRRVQGSTSDQSGMLSWQERMSTMKERIVHNFMNPELSDVIFLVGPEKVEVPAHKTLLCFCSPVFQAQFLGPMSRQSEPLSAVEIEDIDADTFINFLSFLYTDEIKDGGAAGVKEYLDLMYPARKYLVPALGRMCVEELMDRLTPENVFQVYQSAVMYDEAKLKKMCVRYMDRMSVKIMETREFLNLEDQMVSVFLGSDGLVASEQQIHRAALRWAEAKLEREGIQRTIDSMRTALGPLLYLIRFPTMDPKEFSAEEKQSVLLQDEIIALYRKICNSTASPSDSLFPTTKREFHAPVYSAARFPPSSIEIHDLGIGRERAYQIQVEFRTNKRIFLHGVSLFSIFRNGFQPSSHDNLKFEIDMAVNLQGQALRKRKMLQVVGDLIEGGGTGRPANGGSGRSAVSAMPSCYRVYFDEHLEVPPRKTVYIHVEVQKAESRKFNLRTFFGRTGNFEVPRDYDVPVECPEDDRTVTFHFANRINSELGVYSHGQVPEILFSL